MDILQVQPDESCVSPHRYWWLDTLLYCCRGCGTDICGQSSEDARLAPLRLHCSAAVHMFMSINNTIGCNHQDFLHPLYITNILHHVDNLTSGPVQMDTVIMIMMIIGANAIGPPSSPTQTILLPGHIA